MNKLICRVVMKGANLNEPFQSIKAFDSYQEAIIEKKDLEKNHDCDGLEIVAQYCIYSYHEDIFYPQYVEYEP